MKKTNEYIERDAVIITINKYRIGLRKQGLVILDGAVAEVKKRIDSLPAADVRTVVRGHWVPVTNGRGGHECDQCHDYAPSYLTGEERLSYFCPNCGADMRCEK